MTIKWIAFSFLIFLFTCKFYAVKSLTVFDRNSDAGGLEHLAEHFDAETWGTNSRWKRDLDHPNITTKTNVLNDTHQQLMVHWVGEGSNVIICLARDPSSRNKVPLNPSAVFISYDYGDTFVNKTEYFLIGATKADGFATLDKFYNHPKYNTHILFTDTQNKLLYTTKNHGHNISRHYLEFHPSEILFHEMEPYTYIALDKIDPQHKLWITTDFGVTWRVLQLFVKSFYWFSGPNEEQGGTLVVEREEPTGSNTILSIPSSNLDATHLNVKVLIENVKNFQVKGDFMFATKKIPGGYADFYVSNKREPFKRAVFDTDLERREFLVADVTNNRIMVAVCHNDITSHLYVSIDSSPSDIINFQVSLPNILAFFPNTSWQNSWLPHVAEETFADLYKIEGLKGIYIASQVKWKPINHNISPESLISMITFDHGGQWRPIKPPKFNEDGTPVNCSAVNNCSLHLSQRFNQLYPDTRSVSILSSKSAPGIILATGVIGQSLKGRHGVYISRNAGLTWSQVLKDNYFFNMGDHGGILIAVKYAVKSRGETRHVLFSIDEGETWSLHEFNADDLRVYGLMTEPCENTTVFTMFGSARSHHQWIIIKVDLKNVFERNCTKEDYKFWSPSSDGEERNLMPCILGKEETYQRRNPHSRCYNGIDYDRPVKVDVCQCDVEDFECDIGFIQSGNPFHCIRNKSAPNPYAIPADCKSGNFYNRTKGYKKIKGDVCVGGYENRYLPDQFPCPFSETKNFLIVARREKIVRIDLFNKTQEVLPVTGLKNVIAIDFDRIENCVYYADIVQDIIGRQCLSNGTSTPEILVESELASIEGMAFDPATNMLYFVDGMRAKIEVIKTNIKHTGRMRKTILGPEHLVKPRGIAVHSKAGYIFWTDWAPNSPSISRADCNGSNIIQLFTKPTVKWPNGITIDHIAERIYWVDAREDYIASCDLNGERFKKVLEKDDRVSHPFAVAVFKDLMYWDDWKQNAIFSADKDFGIGVQTIDSNLLGLMDLKVYAYDKNYPTSACENVTECTHLCIPIPKGRYVCACPDGMVLLNNTCLCPDLVKPYANQTCPKMKNSCSAEQFTCDNGLCIPKEWKCDSDDDCGDQSDEKCSSQTCSANMFSCGDGKCIPNYWKCDYQRDCNDGSDEINCKLENCTAAQFSCKNGRCISNQWRCDGEDDCRDGSDEMNCSHPSTTCRADEYKCKGNGQCIPLAWQCDSENDCSDGSDEKNCKVFTCNEELEFKCLNNRCIAKNFVCDGDNDCGDKIGSDEVNCTTTTPHLITTPPTVFNTTCHNWMFLCGDHKCIPAWWKCDGINDCSDGSDERGCGTEAPFIPKSTAQPPLPHVCGPNKFQCISGDCIPQDWICDGSSDCSQGEDEAKCTSEHTYKKCGKNFRCRLDGSCISISKVCDGRADCPDGSDEVSCTPEHNEPTGASTVSCSVGFFPCDNFRCQPLSKYCDGVQDCYDNFDEQSCKDKSNSPRVYQVLQMGVDERSVNSTSLLLYWWIPIPQSVQFQFLPSISKAHVSRWRNHTQWIDDTDFRFNNLEPYTEYNMTVYVKVANKSDIFAPAKYFNASTGEGIPSPPYGVTAVQRNGSHVEVSWKAPKQPNGCIVDYIVSQAPPIPPIQVHVHSNATTYMLNSHFEGGVNYSFWVVAINGINQSNSSELSILNFDGDADLDYVSSLKIDEVTNTSVSLSWKAVTSAEGYQITPVVNPPYPQQTPLTTNINSITVSNLSPGVTYSFKIKAYKKAYKGHESGIVVTTKGDSLQPVQNMEAHLIKQTTVKVAWEPPRGGKHIPWQYGVYYAVTAGQLFLKPKATTTNTSMVVKDLEACEKYLFAVGIVGPLGYGPLNGNPVMIQTNASRLAPPKNLQVLPDGHNANNMIVEWSPSCVDASLNIGYTITITETNLNKTASLTLLPMHGERLTHMVAVHQGGQYAVTIQTSEPESKIAGPVIYYARPFYPPHRLQALPEKNGSYILYWETSEILPESTTYNFEVLVSEGIFLNESSAQSYDVKAPPFMLNDVKEGAIYAFAVRLKTNDGYKSLLSEVNTIEIPTSDGWSAVLSAGSIVGILVPSILIVVALLGVLIFFVLKHRRLEQSFVRFANSHYDTRSGATTFGGQGLEDDEGPVIRGFSDDEPLVIA